MSVSSNYGKLFMVTMFISGGIKSIYVFRPRSFEKMFPHWRSWLVGWDKIWSNEIATSHDLGPQNVAFWFREMGPLISGKSRLVKYYNLPR